jgi:acyl carrier protein
LEKRYNIVTPSVFVFLVSSIMSTFDKVKEIIINSSKIDGSKIVENASFKDDLGLDSLEQAELIMEFEKNFDCEIPEDAAEKIITVSDAVKYLDSLQK